MFEFRLRILDVGEGREPSFLGIVEGFPGILTYSTSVERAELDLANALIEHLKRSQDLEATLLQLDDFPTVRVTRLTLCSAPQ